MNADNGMPSVPGLAASEFHSCPSCRMLTCRGRVSREADVTPFGRTTVKDTTHTRITSGALSQVSMPRVGYLLCCLTMLQVQKHISLISSDLSGDQNWKALCAAYCTENIYQFGYTIFQGAAFLIPPLSTLVHSCSLILQYFVLFIYCIIPSHCFPR